MIKTPEWRQILEVAEPPRLSICSDRWVRGRGGELCCHTRFHAECCTLLHSPLHCFWSLKRICLAETRLGKLQNECKWECPTCCLPRKMCLPQTANLWLGYLGRWVLTTLKMPSPPPRGLHLRTRHRRNRGLDRVGVSVFGPPAERYYFRSPVFADSRLGLLEPEGWPPPAPWPPGSEDTVSPLGSNCPLKWYNCGNEGNDHSNGLPLSTWPPELTRGPFTRSLNTR